MANDPSKAATPPKAKPWVGVRPLMNRKVADLFDRFKEVHREIDLERCPRDKETIVATIDVLYAAKKVADSDVIKDVGNPDRWFPWIIGGIGLMVPAASIAAVTAAVGRPDLYILAGFVFVVGAAVSLTGAFQYRSAKASADEFKKQNDTTAKYEELAERLRNHVRPGKYLELEDGTHTNDALGYKHDFDMLEGFTEKLLDMSYFPGRTGWMIVEHIYSTIASHSDRRMTEEYREALAALKKRADHVRAEQDRDESETKSRALVRVSVTDDQTAKDAHGVVGSAMSDVTEGEEARVASDSNRRGEA